MKKKIFTLFFMLLFLTGCEVSYKLEYFNNEFNESMEVFNLEGLEEEVKNIYSFDLSTNYLDVSDLTKEEGLDLGYTYYDKSLIEDNGVSLFYKYKFKEFEYQNSQIGRTLFPNMSFNNNNFSSGNIGDIFIQYPELERITIEFKTDKYVTFNNANKVENDIYYWYIDRTNYSRKNIKINLSDQDNRNVLEKIQEKTNEINDEEIDDFINYIFILLGAVLVIIIIIVFVKIKNSNKK